MEMACKLPADCLNQIFEYYDDDSMTNLQQIENKRFYAHAYWLVVFGVRSPFESYGEPFKIIKPWSLVFRMNQKRFYVRMESPFQPLP